jgi:hypothetical protein
MLHVKRYLLTAIAATGFLWILGCDTEQTTQDSPTVRNPEPQVPASPPPTQSPSGGMSEPGGIGAPNPGTTGGMGGQSEPGAMGGSPSDPGGSPAPGAGEQGAGP